MNDNDTHEGMEDTSGRIEPYKKTPTLTIEQAIMKMLGYHPRCDDEVQNDVALGHDDSCENQVEHADADPSQAELELQEPSKEKATTKDDQYDVALGLDDFCENQVEYADADLSQAKLELQELSKEKATTKDALLEAERLVADREGALTAAKALYQRAEELRSHLNHEITKIRAGKRSLLAIDEEQTQSRSEIRITEASLDEWSAETLDNETWHSTQEANESALDNGLTRVKAESAYVTIGLLTELLAKYGPSLFGDEDHPNHKQIATAVRQYASDLNGKKPMSGQSIRAVTQRLDLASYHLHCNIEPKH